MSKPVAYLLAVQRADHFTDIGIGNLDCPSILTAYEFEPV